MLGSFPRGWSGLGLLLLRVVVGVALVAHGVRAIAGAGSSTVVVSLGALTICAGAALVIGFYTVVVALMSAAGTIGIALEWIPWRRSESIDPGVATIFFVSMCVAIALLGPGAISLDARLRGRREIVIPAHSSKVNH